MLTGHVVQKGGLRMLGDHNLLGFGFLGRHLHLVGKSGDVVDVQSSLGEELPKVPQPAYEILSDYYVALGWWWLFMFSSLCKCFSLPRP